MPFAMVTKSSLGSSGPLNDEVRMGWHLANVKAKTRTIYFAVSRSLIDKVGWIIDQDDERLTNKVGCKIAIMEGTYEDQGFIMLVEHRERDGYRLGNNKGASAITAMSMGVTLGRLKHYVLNDDVLEKEPRPVEYTIDVENKTILIECPDWLRYNPQSVPELPPAPEPPVIAAQHLDAEQAREVAKPSRPPTKPTTTREVVIEVTNEVGKEKGLNRLQRRRVASSVARALSH